MDEQVPRLVVCGKTDTGLRRRNNEDSYVIKDDAGLCAVADGMGGAANGALASQLFVEAARRVFHAPVCEPEDRAVELVVETFKTANSDILRHGKEDPQSAGMGCTGELLVLCNGRYVLGHVGDSRTYLFRNGVLRQLTRDHSLVQDQLDQGLITPEEAKNHRYRNVILRAVGINETLALDLVRGKVSLGDTFLVCSDGLTTMLENDFIARILSSPSQLEEKADRLVQEANTAGGRDNITVVLAHVVRH